MKNELPAEPLRPNKFAREIGVSPVRLFRVTDKMDPPLNLVDGKIPVDKYPEIIRLLVNEPKVVNTEAQQIVPSDPSLEG